LVCFLCSGQTLLIDADDTLWENNVYLSAPIAASSLSRSPHVFASRRTPDAYEVERETILRTAMALTSFTRSLLACLSG